MEWEAWREKAVLLTSLLPLPDDRFSPGSYGSSFVQHNRQVLLLLQLLLPLLDPLPRLRHFHPVLVVHRGGCPLLYPSHVYNGSALGWRPPLAVLSPRLPLLPGQLAALSYFKFSLQSRVQSTTWATGACVASCWLPTGVQTRWMKRISHRACKLCYSRSDGKHKSSGRDKPSLNRWYKRRVIW